MEISFKKKMSSIKFIAFDVDGVLTDGSLLLIGDEQVRTMNIKDGFAIGEAIRKGLLIVIISGGAPSNGVRKRLEHLGVQEIHLGVKNKKSLLFDLMKKYGIDKDQIAYMGDDLPDYEVLELAGLKCCPSDAVAQIKEKCDFISSYTGGGGCVRDLLEQIMRLQGSWPFSA
ncbi:MAG: KdsC family phosphatase [Bacteroidota bacterium]